MVTIDFSGYGGEYCIGKLTDREVENIKVLLQRFDPDVFLFKYDIFLDTDSKEHFYDFNDVVSAWCLTDNFHATIRETVREDDWEDLDFSESEAEYKNVSYPNDGFYINSCGSEKGFYFTIQIPIELKDFDASKLKFHYDDLSTTWLNDSVITGVSYDDMDLELDMDGADTTGKGFYQYLTLVENGNQSNGFEFISDGVEPKYETLDDVDDAETIIFDYLHINESSEIPKIDSHIVYHSPLLYDKFPKEDIDKLWYNKADIKHAIEKGLIDEIPQHIREKVDKENPEWLI